MHIAHEDRDEQCDVLTRRQLRACGVDHDVVRSQVRARRWQVVGPKVIVLHNGPLTTLQWQWAVVLNQPAGAALSGLRAAAHHGLSGFSTDSIDVVVPHGRRPVPVAGATIHQVRRFTSAELHPARRPPMVRVERAIVDAAVWSRSPRKACGIVAASVQQRLTTAERLSAELDARRGTRHLPLLRSVCTDIAGGAHSLAEIDLGPPCRAAGLPPPRRQAVRLDAYGRRRYLDADCGTFSVEVDGAVHLHPLTWIEDAVRGNELVIAGERVLRIPASLFRLEPDLVVDQLRRAADRFGSARP